MTCSLSSCRFNADGECCNAEAYQQCINACEAVLGEEYQRFKVFEKAKKQLLTRDFSLQTAKDLYNAFGSPRYAVLGANNCVAYLTQTYEEAQEERDKLSTSVGSEFPIIDLKEWESVKNERSEGQTRDNRQN